MTGNPSQTGRRHYVGIFLLSLATLLLELSLTRVLAVASWHHFGFLVISTALLGFGASGVVLTLWTGLRERMRLDRALAVLCVAFGVVTVLSFWLMQQIPFDPFKISVDRRQFFFIPLYYIILSAPFFCSGLAIALLIHALLGAGQPAVRSRLAGRGSRLRGNRRGDARVRRLGLGGDRGDAGNDGGGGLRVLARPPPRRLRGGAGRLDVCCRAGRRPSTADLRDS